VVKAFDTLSLSGPHNQWCESLTNSSMVRVGCMARVMDFLQAGKACDTLPWMEEPRTLINCLNIGSQRAVKRRRNGLENQKRLAHIAKVIMRHLRLIYR
jgi:hypothetical protein